MSTCARLEASTLADSPEELQALAAGLAAELPADATLALHGDLGAGKTTFVRGLARAWGIKDPVTSPSYNLCLAYRGTRTLVHVDAYRLRGPADADGLLLEEMLVSPWCLAVEWPERLGPWLPADAWHLHLEASGPTRRRVRLSRPGGARG